MLCVVISHNLLALIKNVESGITVIFDNKEWLCYPQYVFGAFGEGVVE